MTLSSSESQEFEQSNDRASTGADEESVYVRVIREAVERTLAQQHAYHQYWSERGDEMRELGLAADAEMDKRRNRGRKSG